MTHVPLFSIIIPTYNRPEQLTRCLEAISRLQYTGGGFEVIVVDDGGDMKLDEIMPSFPDGLALTFVRQSNAGPAVARNTGAASAQGKYLAFTDDDCQPAHDWLLQLEHRFQQTPDRMIGGRTVNRLTHNMYARASQMIIDAVYEYHNADSDQAHFFTSNNMAVPKEEFLKIGGFNPDLRISEDRELCDRWRFSGLAMTYASEMVIYHAPPLTFSRFWRQHFGYGCGAFQFHQLRAQRQQKQLTVEQRSFYRHLLAYPLSQPRYREKFLLEALLILSQIASTAGFLREYFRQAKTT